MSDNPTVRFSCDAKPAIACHPDAKCNNSIEVELFNDGQYTSFVTPQDWHIELGDQSCGENPRPAIIRCPTHCEWVYDDPDIGRYGHWEDAP